ncbi:MAG: DUF2147 domain-containing protein [Candidatus Cloacimonetes bacterium]|nr:DUF2147 domain-containing protein [Candidatus Cloacimonadota bacterium]MBS3768259.1 DUF2147 domain-containing protein [Candidatus Cloacimonadota bacterium]
MKKSIFIFVILLLVFLSGSTLMAKSSSPVGFWKTIDDESGEKKSVVEIWQDQGKLYGKIVKLFRKPDEDPNPVCAEGSGELTGKPMLGATIMRNLKEDEDSDWWIDGLITDPKKGKTYHCKIKVIENGEKLRVRGYIKALFKIGRSQYWLRTEDPNIEKKMEIKNMKKSPQEK